MRQVSTRWPLDTARMARMSIIEEGPVQQIRMAYLAVLGSHSVNGVARLHTELIKSDLLPEVERAGLSGRADVTVVSARRRWTGHSGHWTSKTGH